MKIADTTAVTPESLSAAASQFGFDQYDLTIPPSVKEKDSTECLVFKATKILSGNKITIKTYDYNGTTEKAPDEPGFGNDYYLRVAIRNKESHEIVGWMLKRIDWTGSSTSIAIEKFLPTSDQVLQTQETSDHWIRFDPTEHYIEVDTEGNNVYPARIIRSNEIGTMVWKDAIDPSKINDLPPEHYAFIKGEQDDGYIIKLKKDSLLLRL